jgi:hypothetical protein
VDEALRQGSSGIAEGCGPSFDARRYSPRHGHYDRQFGRRNRPSDVGHHGIDQVAVSGLNQEIPWLVR